MDFGLLLLIVGAYVVGSVNTATILARARGIDIYAEGSGNPGASNVYRLMGKRAAATVYLADLAKGFGAALVGLLVWNEAAACAAGLAAVVGHCYPVFHRFRGGKGVATGGGVVLAVAPFALLGLIVVYAVLVAVTKISAVGSLGAIVGSVPAVLITGVRGWALAWFVATIALIVFRHRANLSRLLKGAENRVVTT